MIDATKIEELLTRAEGLQRQIEDLQGLARAVLEPVEGMYEDDTLSADQEDRYQRIREALRGGC